MDAQLQKIIDGFVNHGSDGANFGKEAQPYFQEAIRITMEINNSYHDPEELRELMRKLTGRNIDDSFRLFPPFYTDFGKNIHFGKDVFVNSSCHFQDQGGIYIGDGTLIGHNVVIATINHELDPSKKRANKCFPVRISNNVWIGSNVTILPGVSIGEWSVIGAGSVVNKDVPPYSVYAGVPARFIKKVEETKS